MYLPSNTLLQGGKYKIVSFISSGGFGNTYEAIDVECNKKIAIKEFFMKDSCNREETTNRVIVATKAKEEQVTRMKEKFMKEAHALLNMSHPNIVHVENAFEENATTYYVMDYIEGTSLNDIIKVAGSLSEEKTLDYIMQIADALKYVHSLNRLHLDIKPGNIMIDKNGKAILIDFGASKQYDEVTGENTSTLLGINTTGYAPAEQSYRGFVQFAPSTDIYALGATLYKLLTGITPPDAQMLKDGEVELAPLPSNISESVKKSIKEAMRPLRKDRPQSIDEWVAIFSVQNICQAQSKSTEKEKTLFDSPVSEQIRKDYKSEFYKTYSYELESEAKNGNAAAEFALACCYDEGLGIKENIQLGIYWFEKAGNHGYLDAMVRLGFIYLGTAELYSKYANTNKCIFWYTKAAEQGDEYACFELGRFYKEGKIVKKDIAKAKYWFDKVIKLDGNNKVEAVNELNELIKYNDSKKILFLLLTIIFTEFCLGVVAYDAMEINYHHSNHHSLVTTPSAELRTFRFGGMLASFISLVMVFSIGLKKYSKLGNICILAISCITILLAFQSFNSSILDIARIYYILTLIWVGGTFIYSCTSIKQAFRTPTNIIIIISMMLFSVMWFLFTCIKYGDTIF